MGHYTYYRLLLFVCTGKILWVREEALSQIVTVELLDLPASDTEVAIEKEFDSKESKSSIQRHLLMEKR